MARPNETPNRAQLIVSKVSDADIGLARDAAAITVTRFHEQLARYGDRTIFQDHPHPYGLTLGPTLKPDQHPSLDCFLTDPLCGAPIFSDPEKSWTDVADVFAQRSSFLRNWPSTTNVAGLKAWKTRLLEDHPVVSRRWRRLGIDHLIHSSLMTPPAVHRLFAALTLFWSDGLNVFLFSRGPMTITLLDVFVLTGAPLDGEVPCFSRPYHHDPSLDTYKFLSIPEAISRFASGTDEPFEVDHAMFLWTWLSCFIVPAAGKLSGVALGIASTLSVGKKQALAPFMLSCIYRSFYAARSYFYTGGEKALHGPLWVVQWWFQAYFTNLSPEASRYPLGFYMNRREFPQYTPSYYIGLFLEKNPRPPFRWFPYVTVDGLPSWVRERIIDSDGRKLWLDTCITRDLLHGAPSSTLLSDRPSTLGLLRGSDTEVYHPQFAARQLGLVQGLPSPFTLSRNIYRSGRVTHRSSSEVLHDCYFRDRMAAHDTFPRHIPVSDGEVATPSFLAWWGHARPSIVLQAFQDRIELPPPALGL